MNKENGNSKRTDKMRSPQTEAGRKAGVPEKIWINGIMGVVVGDALGCPVQFLTKEEIAEKHVWGMQGYGTYNMPEGTWTDDGSMTLATAISIREKGSIDLKDIMDRFADWLENGRYTPYGQAFDIGGGTMTAINKYIREGDVTACGGTDARNNGNGSLMRILPACLYCYEQQKAGGLTDGEAIDLIHRVSGLTHNHIRAKIACGLYYFMCRAVIDGEEHLRVRLQKGIDDGFEFYGKDLSLLTELAYYGRLRDLRSFCEVPESEIRSGGYVVETIEAAVWCLLNGGNFEDTLLSAVKLGHDTDTVGAVCGGLAGLCYGYHGMPAAWLNVISRRDWIEEICGGRPEYDLPGFHDLYSPELIHPLSEVEDDLGGIFDKASGIAKGSVPSWYVKYANLYFIYKGRAYVVNSSRLHCSEEEFDHATNYLKNELSWKGCSHIWDTTMMD